MAFSLMLSFCCPAGLRHLLLHVSAVLTVAAPFFAGRCHHARRAVAFCPDEVVENFLPYLPVLLRVASLHVSMAEYSHLPGHDFFFILLLSLPKCVHSWGVVAPV